MFPKRIAKLIIANQPLKSFCRLKSENQSSRAVGKLFFDAKIQDALNRIANVELKDVFTVKKTGERLKPPEYKFMTDQELKAAVNDAEKRAELWKQMPPVLDPRSDEVQIITEDIALDGHDEHKASFVFTDITYGVPEQERLIVVREPDGILRQANWDQRHRMNQLYSPRPGREYVKPPMFDDEQLELLLNRKEYIFILDRACAQFEPHDPDYVRITTTTYSRIAKDRAFNYVRTTRHFGSLVFYLVFNKDIDLLLLEYLQNEKLDEAVSVINLYHMIHPNCDSAQSTANEGVDLIRAFIQKEVTKRSVLELALKTCEERLAQQNNQSSLLQQVHGVNQQS